MCIGYDLKLLGRVEHANIWRIVMFIGHFAVAFLLMWLFPNVNPLVPLIGVSFPDLLWPFLVFSGVEKLTVNPDSPLQKDLVFLSYPFSHSLVMGTLVASGFGLVLGLLLGALSGVVFVLASASHWVLDILVHMKDLPVTGMRNDRKVGLGLWGRPRLAFILEYLFYGAMTLLFVPSSQIMAILVLGGVFHLINSNSFLGFTRRNPTRTSRAYAGLALFGFSAFIVTFILVTENL